MQSNSIFSVKKNPALNTQLCQAIQFFWKEPRQKNSQSAPLFDAAVFHSKLPLTTLALFITQAIFASVPVLTYVFQF